MDVFLWWHFVIHGKATRSGWPRNNDGHRPDFTVWRWMDKLVNFFLSCNNSPCNPMAVTKTPDEENNAIQELYTALGSEYAHLDREVCVQWTIVDFYFPAHWQALTVLEAVPHCTQLECGMYVLSLQQEHDIKSSFRKLPRSNSYQPWHGVKKTRWIYILQLPRTTNFLCFILCVVLIQFQMATWLLILVYPNLFWGSIVGWEAAVYTKLIRMDVQFTLSAWYDMGTWIRRLDTR